MRTDAEKRMRGKESSLPVKPKLEKEEFVVFVDKEGNPVFAVPGNTTIGQWVKMGLPPIHLVSKHTPWKTGEVRNK